MGGYVLIDMARFGTIDTASNPNLIDKGIGYKIQSAVNTGKPILFNNLLLTIGGSSFNMRSVYASTFKSAEGAYGCSFISTGINVLVLVESEDHIVFISALAG